MSVHSFVASLPLINFPFLAVHTPVFSLPSLSHTQTLFRWAQDLKPHGGGWAGVHSFSALCFQF